MEHANLAAFLHCFSQLTLFHTKLLLLSPNRNMQTCNMQILLSPFSVFLSWLSLIQQKPCVSLNIIFIILAVRTRGSPPKPHFIIIWKPMLVSSNRNPVFFLTSSSSSQLLEHVKPRLLQGGFCWMKHFVHQRFLTLILTTWLFEGPISHMKPDVGLIQQKPCVPLDFHHPSCYNTWDHFCSKVGSVGWSILSIKDS